VSEQVGGEAVAQFVGRDAVVEPCDVGVALEVLPESLPGEGSAACRDEDRGGAVLARECEEALTRLVWGGGALTGVGSALHNLVSGLVVAGAATLLFLEGYLYDKPKGKQAFERAAKLCREAGGKAPAAGEDGAVYARFPKGPSSEELAQATRNFLMTNRPEALESKVEVKFRDKGWKII
jgi:hypothetical protein